MHERLELGMMIAALLIVAVPTLLVLGIGWVVLQRHLASRAARPDQGGTEP